MADWLDWAQPGMVIAGKYVIRERLSLSPTNESAVFLVDRCMRDLTSLNSQAVLKIMATYQDSHVSEQRLNEVQVACGLDHSHIIRTYDADRFVTAGQQFLYLAMERADCSLHDVVGKSNCVPAHVAYEIAVHLAEALSFLHRNGIVHRDVKPGNVLHAGNAWKLGDFGTIGMIGNSGGTAFQGGTIHYCSPEHYGCASLQPPMDIWSYGVLLARILTGRLPFSFPNTVGRSTADLRRNYEVITSQRPAISPDVPSPFLGIIRGCLVVDPTRRLSADEVSTRLKGDPQANTGRSGAVPNALQTWSTTIPSIAEWMSDSTPGAQASARLREPGDPSEAEAPSMDGASEVCLGALDPDSTYDLMSVRATVSEAADCLGVHDYERALHLLKGVLRLDVCIPWAAYLHGVASLRASAARLGRCCEAWPSNLRNLLPVTSPQNLLMQQTFEELQTQSNGRKVFEIYRRDRLDCTAMLVAARPVVERAIRETTCLDLRARLVGLLCEICLCI